MNPLGELISGFARVRGPVTMIGNLIVDEGAELSPENPNCEILLKDERRLEATVFFDFPEDFAPSKTTEDNLTDEEFSSVCRALMISPHVGIAISATDAARTEYRRVGILCVDFDRRLDMRASHYPAPSSLVLV